MNNVFVYCEIEKTTVEEVSLELLTKGRKLANRLGVKLEAICAGTGIKVRLKNKFCLMAWTFSTFSTTKDCIPTRRNPTRQFS